MVRPSLFASSKGDNKGNSGSLLPGRICCRKVAAAANQSNRKTLIYATAILALLGVVLVSMSSKPNVSTLNEDGESTGTFVMENGIPKMIPAQEGEGMKIKKETSSNAKKKEKSGEQVPKKETTKTKQESTTASTKSSSSTPTKTKSSSTTTSTNDLPPKGNLPHQIPIESNSTMAKDIESILHDPARAQIAITLNDHAKCARPYLVGRLSGPALVRLEKWTGSTPNTLYYHYHVPIPQEYYYIEILAVYCNDFFHAFNKPDNPIHHTDLHKDWLVSRPDLRHYMKKEFHRECPVKMGRQRITGPGAMIWTTNPTVPPQPKQKWMGFWYNTKYTASDGIQSLQPVYTRHQPANCKDDDTKCPLECSTDRFDAYQFRWNKETPLSVKKLKQSPDHQDIICLLGDSHSRQVEAASREMGLTLEDSHVQLRNSWVTFAENVTEKFVGDVVAGYKCTHMVVGVGQWAAFPNPKQHEYHDGMPYTLNEFYRTTKSMVQALVHHEDVNGQEIGVYIRTLDAQPLRAANAGTCPPQKDWSNPVVLEAYNTILKRIAVEFDIHFIDTESFLVGPVWDAAPDWFHLNVATNEALTLFVTASALQPSA